jgi:FAD:protein FMN transferase
MMQKITFDAMGTHMSAFLDDDDQAAADLLAQIPEWFETWEQSLSRFRPDSELSRLNNAAGSGNFIAVSPILWDVLTHALQAHAESGGLVTPAILNELENAGYDRDFDQLAALADYTSQDYLPDSIPLDQIEMDAQNRALRSPAGLRLDFGGVAKGWAAHQAAARLAPFGPALVNAGGDIAITAPPLTSEFWPIGIDNPYVPGDSLATLKVAVGGVATSGRDHRRWQKNGRWQHHIIDPRRGLPAETDLLSATIIAPSAVAAETAAKLVMILGSNSGLGWLEQHPHLSGLMIDENGQRITSLDFSQYLWS